MVDRKLVDFFRQWGPGKVFVYLYRSVSNTMVPTNKKVLEGKEASVKRGGMFVTVVKKGGIAVTNKDN